MMRTKLVSNLKRFSKFILNFMICIIYILGCSKNSKLSISKNSNDIIQFKTPRENNNVIFAEKELTVVELLTAKKFKCIQSDLGYICSIHKVNTSGFKYSQPIAVIISPEANEKNTKELITYIHGYRNVCKLKSGTSDINATSYELVEAFDIDKTAFSLSHKKNYGYLFVMPISKGKNDNHKLELMNNFTGYQNWLSQTLSTTKDNLNWHIMGHSGAGSIIANILNSSYKVTHSTNTIGLLDATYGMSNYIEKWKNAVANNKQLKIISVYKPGSSTEPGSIKLATELNKNNAKKVKLIQTKTRHCEIPNIYLERVSSELLPPK